MDDRVTIALLGIILGIVFSFLIEGLTGDPIVIKPLMQAEPWRLVFFGASSAMMVVGLIYLVLRPTAPPASAPDAAGS